MAKLTSAACRAARGILKWSVRDLAREAGVSPTTVNLLEADRPYRQGTADKIIEALERQGVEITNGNGTGARLLPIWRVDYAKTHERRFSAQPASGQAPGGFPDFATPDEMRDWLSSKGYRELAGEADRWVFTGARAVPELVADGNSEGHEGDLRRARSSPTSDDMYAVLRFLAAGVDFDHQRYSGAFEQAGRDGFRHNDRLLPPGEDFLRDELAIRRRLGLETVPNPFP